MADLRESTVGPAQLACKGGMASLGLRHAGDTPVEGFIWRKSPFAGPPGGWREACWVEVAAVQVGGGRAGW